MSDASDINLASFTPLLDQMFDAVYVVDRNRQILYWNPAAERLTGYSRGQTVDRTCYDGLLCHVDSSGQLLCQGRCPLAQTITDGKPRQDEIYLHHRDGHRVPVRVRCSPLRDANGEIVGGLEVFEDMSGAQSIRERLAELEHLALVDPLTGLANRRHAQDVLDHLLDEARRYSTDFAVILIDVDDFKQVNDTCGHDTGDRVLTMVAGTLSHNLRPFDLVARWGGDEFIAALRHVSVADLTVIAERVRMLVASSYLETDRQRLSVTVSMGGTLARSGDTRGGLVDRADRNLYVSKHGGRDRFTLDRDGD